MSDLFLSEERAAKFWAKVDRRPGEDDCWPWLGPDLWAGAGMFALDSGKLMSAHRLAYLLTHPEEDLSTLTKYVRIIQTCENRKCCRPEHLAKGKGGTKALPEGERLVSQGMHFQPQKLAMLREICETGLYESQREFIEDMIDRIHERLVKGGKIVPKEEAVA